MLVFLAASAGTGIVAAYFGSHPYRLLLDGLGIVIVFFFPAFVPATACSGIFFLAGFHAAHIGTLFTSLADLAAALTGLR